MGNEACCYCYLHLNVNSAVFVVRIRVFCHTLKPSNFLLLNQIRVELEIWLTRHCLLGSSSLVELSV
uniref:Putative ovule protein n=1 Tax=Solanum chacoense TaxID=4108 RepID=A0A0V0ICC8_SOLCH